MTQTAERSLDITVYRITGKQLFFKVSNSFCDVTDPVVNSVRQVLAEIGRPDVPVKVRPYLNHLPAALLRGVYHPPAVLIGKKVFSQGVLPDPSELKDAIRRALSKL